MIDPEVARTRASIAGNTRWANEPNRTAATAKMRAGFVDKLRREAREKLGPGATDEQVTAAADNALKAHYAKMRLNSLTARRRRVQERQREAAETMAGEILAASPDEAA